MATHNIPAPSAPTVSPDQTTWTTRRAAATWSFCAGLWSSLVFWWYPYSLFIATCGMIFGLVALVRGWRSGKDGDNLALAGVIMCSITIGTTLTFYRAVQFYFGDLSEPIAP